MHRRQEHDRAVAVAERGTEIAREEHRTEIVVLQRALHLVRGRHSGLRTRGIAGEHDETVRLPERDRGGDERVACRRLVHVAADHTHRRRAARAQRRGHAFGTLAIGAVAEHERRAFVVQRAREDCTDAARSASEDAHPPGERCRGHELGSDLVTERAKRRSRAAAESRGATAESRGARVERVGRSGVPGNAAYTRLLSRR